MHNSRISRELIDHGESASVIVLGGRWCSKILFPWAGRWFFVWLLTSVLLFGIPTLHHPSALTQNFLRPGFGKFFPAKSQTINILSVVGHMSSVEISQLCYCCKTSINRQYWSKWSWLFSHKTLFEFHIIFMYHEALLLFIYLFIYVNHFQLRW